MTALPPDFFNRPLAEVGAIIAAALQPGFEERKGELAERVQALAERYPLYAHLGAPAAV